MWNFYVHSVPKSSSGEKQTQKGTKASSKIMSLSAMREIVLDLWTYQNR
jgi:hypothetical protein